MEDPGCSRLSEIHDTYLIPCRVQEIKIMVRQFSVVGDLLLPVMGTKHPVIIMVWGDGEAGRHTVGKPSKLIRSFIESGYAVFLEDRPGFGASTGEFSKGGGLRQDGGHRRRLR